VIKERLKHPWLCSGQKLPEQVLPKIYKPEVVYIRGPVPLGAEAAPAGLKLL